VLDSVEKDLEPI